MNKLNKEGSLQVKTKTLMKMEKSLKHKKDNVNQRRVEETVIMMIKKNRKEAKLMMTVGNNVTSKTRRKIWLVGHLNRTKMEMAMILKKKKTQEF